MRELLAGVVVALALLACEAPDDPAPTGDRCDGAPRDAAIDGLEILTDRAPTLALDDGATLPLLFGGQGTEMTLFRVGVRGPAAPTCLRLEIRARRPDGGVSLDLVDALVVEPVGELGATGVIAALDPGDAVAIEVSAYGATVRRELMLGGVRVSISLAGPSALASAERAELTVELSGRAVEPLELLLDAAPAGVVTLDSPSLTLAAGESSATFGVRGVGIGRASVRARLDAYESAPLWLDVTP